MPYKDLNMKSLRQKERRKLKPLVEAPKNEVPDEAPLKLSDGQVFDRANLPKVTGDGLTDEKGRRYKLIGGVRYAVK